MSCLISFVDFLVVLVCTMCCNSSCAALGAITGSADQELYLVREDGIDVTVQFTVMVTGGVKGDFSLSLQDVNATGRSEVS